MDKVIQKVKQYVKKEFEKPTACYKEAFNSHFKKVVKYSKQLAEKRNADKEIAEIVAWLHDIGSIQGKYEEHHKVSSEVSVKLLKEWNYPEEKINQVVHCIYSHRGSLDIKKETNEAKILADADALAHFDEIEDLLFKVFDNKKSEVLAKLERSYNKLSDDAKPLVKNKLEQVKKDLK